MKKQTPDGKARELMQLHGTNTPFVIEEVVNNQKNLQCHLDSVNILTFFHNEKFKEFFNFWGNVNREVMKELTANSIIYPETHEVSAKDIFSKSHVE